MKCYEDEYKTCKGNKENNFLILNYNSKALQGIRSYYHNYLDTHLSHLSIMQRDLKKKE